MPFPAKKNAGSPKRTARFPALGLPPPQESVRRDGQTGERTLASQSKFNASIGYQICLPMVLRTAAFGRKGAPLSMKVIHI